MQILINENKEIVNYAIVGGVSSEGYETIEILDSDIPDLFVDLYKPGLFVYQDNRISVNPNYSEYQEEQLEVTYRDIIERHQKEIDYLYEHHQLTKPET